MLRAGREWVGGAVVCECGVSKYGVFGRTGRNTLVCLPSSGTPAEMQVAGSKFEGYARYRISSLEQFGTVQALYSGTAVRPRCAHSVDHHGF